MQLIDILPFKKNKKTVYPIVIWNETKKKEKKEKALNGPAALITKLNLHLHMCCRSESASRDQEAGTIGGSRRELAKLFSTIYE